MEQIDKCCGTCEHLLYESVTGYGICNIYDMDVYCSNGTECPAHEPKEERKEEVKG